MTLLIIGLARLIAGFILEGRERRRAWPPPSPTTSSPPE